VGTQVEELDSSVWSGEIAQQLQRPPSRQRPPPEALHLFCHASHCTLPLEGRAGEALAAAGIADPAIGGGSAAARLAGVDGPSLGAGSSARLGGAARPQTAMGIVMRGPRQASSSRLMG
jgi:hypothetical protein